MSVRLPCLLDENLREVCALHPCELTLDESLSPLSGATMALPVQDCPAKTGSLIALYTAEGFAGIYRVQQTGQRFGGLVTLQLEHGLVTLSDHLMPLAEERTDTARALLTELLACQSSAMWRLGTVDVPDSVKLTWRCDYSNALSGLCSLMAQLPDYRLTFDQSTFPWVLNVKALAHGDLCECRLNRNLCSLTVEEDRSVLCTRLYMEGLPAPLSADTVHLYGVVSRSLSADSSLSADELTARAVSYLEAHKHPALSITLDAIDLSEATGEALDRLTLGRVCRVCLPEQGETLCRRIIRRVFPDVLGEPQRVRVTLASEMDSAVSAMAGLTVDTTGLRRQLNAGLRAQKELILSASERIALLSDEIDLLARDVEINAEHIALKASRQDIDALGSRLSQAEIDIDGANAAIALKASRQDMDALGSRLSQAEITLNGAEGQIGLTGRVTNAEGQISEAMIDVNAMKSQIALKADKIDLQGYVTMQDFEAVTGWTESFAGHSVSADYLVCGTGDFDNLTFGTLAGENCGWESKTVLTSRGNLTVSKRYLTLMKGDGTTVTLDVVTDVSLSASSTTTLNYLGLQ